MTASRQRTYRPVCFSCPYRCDAAPPRPTNPANLAEGPFDGPDWLFDVKYDGFRALGYVERGRSRLISRNGNTFTRFDALADQFATVIEVDDAVLDGEVIAVDETGRPQFYDLLGGSRAPV